MTRSSTDLSDLTTHKLVDFTYLFDLAHFKESLASSCPQMKLYDSVNDLYSFPSTSPPVILNPGDLAAEFINDRILANPSEWRPAFDNFLKDNTPHGLSSTAPVRVQIHNVLLLFPIAYDTDAFTRNFGRLFRFRSDVRRLAASALYSLSTNLSPDLRANSGITSKAYMGAHLRTASDAAKAGWPGYEVQAAAYLSQAAAHDLNVIYVASGSAPDIARFRSDAGVQNRTVVTKEDLLRGEELEELRALSWDQQALVDFEVLSRSSSFGGIEESSFAWMVAVKRHLRSEMVEMEGVEGRAWEDELSVLYGEGGMGYFRLAMWS